MQIHGIEVDITLHNIEKESLQSDVRLRRNRRPKFQHYNSFQQVNSNLVPLRFDALFDSQIHIQDVVKSNYSQKMNARVQRARHTQKESTHLDLRVNGKLQRKKGTTTVLQADYNFTVGAPVRHTFTQ